MTATTALAAAVPTRLRGVRQDLDLEQQQAAAQLGISVAALLRWEKGRVNPRTHHMLAYAALLNRRLTVGRGRTGIYDLADILPNLAALRRSQQLTQREVANRMHVTSSNIGSLEGKAARGEPIGWDLVTRYLEAIGYRVGITRIHSKAVAS